MTQETSTPPQGGPSLDKLWHSIQRDPIPPADDRGRARLVMNNLVLHIHPAKVARTSLKFNYTFGLGGLLILLAFIQGFTGVLLMFAYTPSPEAAYNSMLALQTQVWYGELVRNLHHWSANLMVIVAALHLMRVFFTGGFRTPREFNWVLGISLLLLVVAANFTGYLLPWDQLAYWAVTVGTSLLSYLPLVGNAVARLLLGGPEVGAATLTNFYGLHIAVIPLAIFGIMSFHIWRVRKDELTRPRKVDEPEGGRIERVTTIPHLVSREMVFALVAIAVLITFSALVAAPLESAADPVHSPNPAKAAWYFMGIQELLLHFHPVFGAIVIPLLGLTVLVLLPYLEGDMAASGIWFRSLRGRKLVILSAVLGIVLTAVLVYVDEYYLDLPALLPFLPTWLSNGWIPVAALLMGLIGYGELLKTLFKANNCETRQALFTLIGASFVALTVIGIFFRGPGMMLVLPGGVL